VATRLATRGAGVGLSILKAIIDLHGGAIAVASTPDQGTRVTVTLPGGPEP
jgi:signal transduction histidine kinase